MLKTETDVQLYVWLSMQDIGVITVAMELQ